MAPCRYARMCERSDIIWSYEVCPCAFVLSCAEQDYRQAVNLPCIPKESLTHGNAVLRGGGVGEGHGDWQVQAFPAPGGLAKPEADEIAGREKCGARGSECRRRGAWRCAV